MYTTSHSVSAPMNGMGGDLIDGSGTINPAALNTAGALPGSSISASATSPRGVKRSRSPEQYRDSALESAHDDDDGSRRKRGRPPKTPRTSTSALPAGSPTSTQPQVKTPQVNSQGFAQQNNVTPTQTSPNPKSTPTKVNPVKALPTVRDHTTDQLGKEGDEYIPKEFDEAGEKKVDAMGYLQDGREYKCRTFRVPHRGEKLFMLATECARVLGYRDSYLLFNKNRSLYKIIATQPEKDDLIQQEILPYSYRSRQIAIVTARSMFRQFGSRVIVNGRRVRDDYWESKARKQGFTEDDLAGEKRPGGSKARDAAAAEAANAAIIPTLGHSDVIYSNGPHFDGLATHGLPPGIAGPHSSLAPLPMIHLSPTDDPRVREYASIPRPRPDITGQPYVDRTQPSSAAEIMTHAGHTAEFNKILNQQRNYRSKALEEFWKQPREAPVSVSQSQPGQNDAIPTVTQSLQSPPMGSAAMINPPQQQPMMSHQPQMMTPQSAMSQHNHQAQIAQSPIRGIHQAMRPEQLQQRHSAGAAQTPPYGYPTQSPQAWGPPPPQPQPSPLSSQHHAVGMSQYTPQMHPLQQTPSPHLHQAGLQQHPSQSPRTQGRPQISPSPHMQSQQPNMASMGYPGVSAAGYPALAAARGLYPQSQGQGQQFMTGSQPGAGMGMAGAGMTGWPSTAGGSLPPGQPHPGQSQSPLGNWTGY